MKTNLSTVRRRGFTLVELMVVVLIIAVLAALVVPRVQDRINDSKNAAARSQIARFATLLSQFRIDCDRLPTSEEGLNALLVQPSDVTNWKGPYFEAAQVPLDPWEHEYIYASPGVSGEDSFVITSVGRDNQDGTDDDVSSLDL